MTGFSRIEATRDTECQAMLDACSPELYLSNSFRITGLDINASARSVKRRIEELKLTQDSQTLISQESEGLLKVAQPNTNQIQTAIQRLQDPETRFIEEFFWFWPLDVNSSNGAAQILTSEEQLLAAQEAWKSTESVKSDPASAIACHNLAVSYHLLALACEDARLNASLTRQGDSQAATHWTESIRRWHHLSDDESFWTAVSERIQSKNDARLTTGLARRVRATLLQAINKINAELALRYAQKRDYGATEQHLQLIRDSQSGDQNLPRTLHLILTPILSRIRVLVETSTSAVTNDPKTGSSTAIRLLEAVRDQVRVIQALLPNDDPHREDIGDEVALAVLTCARAYANETDDWRACQHLLSEALVFAGSEHVREKVTKDLVAVTNNDLFERHLHPLEQELEQIDNANLVPSGKLAVAKDVIPRLNSIEKSEGTASAAFLKCADAFAIWLRHFSVEIHNKDLDANVALEAIRLALAWAKDPDLKKTLFTDLQTLQEIHIVADFIERAGAIIQWKVSVDRKVDELNTSCAVAVGSCNTIEQRDRINSAAAKLFRILGLEAANEHHQYEVAAQAIRQASILLRDTSEPDQELRRHLEEDLATLNNILSRINAKKPTSSSATSGQNRPASAPAASPASGQYQPAAPRSPSKSSSLTRSGKVFLSIIGILVVIALWRAALDSNSGTTATSPSTPQHTNIPPAMTPDEQALPQPSFDAPERPLPRTGILRRYSSEEAIAPLQVLTNTTGTNYFLKIEDYYSGQLVATAFVRGGETAQFDLPLGTRRIKYAAGATWYGTKYLFGPATSYSQADQPFQFEVIGNRVRGFTITLYTVADGNLNTSAIKQSEF